MARKKQTDQTDDTALMVFVVGCNLPDGERFEAGDCVPEDIAPEVKAALISMKAIAEVGN